MTPHDVLTPIFFHKDTGSYYFPYEASCKNCNYPINEFIVLCYGWWNRKELKSGHENFLKTFCLKCKVHAFRVIVTQREITLAIMRVPPEGSKLIIKRSPVLVKANLSDGEVFAPNARVHDKTVLAGRFDEVAFKQVVEAEAMLDFRDEYVKDSLFRPAEEVLEDVLGSKPLLPERKRKYIS